MAIISNIREIEIVMHLLIQTRKAIALLVIVSFSTFSIISSPVHAKMINTSKTFQQSQNDLTSKSINTFLDRSEVQKYLVDWGISPEEAKIRIDSLTDEEIENIASRIDRLPAGGDGLGTIVGAALLIFIILLITDILGFTDVFSFVKSR